MGLWRLALPDQTISSPLCGDGWNTICGFMNGVSESRTGAARRVSVLFTGSKTFKSGVLNSSTP